MSDKLLPCPFCGGEAHPMAQHWDDGSHVWWVECRVCEAEGKRCDGGMEAIDAWNTRAERTCRVVKNSRKYVLSDGTELFDDGCSICNGYIGAGENYCSNCGAKVVEEDTNG